MQTLRGQAWRIIGASSDASADTCTGTRSAASSKVGTTAGARAEARAGSRSGASSSSRRRRSIRRHSQQQRTRAAAAAQARTAGRSSCSTHTCAGTGATARCSKTPARGAKAGRCRASAAQPEARAGSTAGRRRRLLSATATAAAAAAAASHLATSAHARRSDRDRILPPPVLRLRPNLPDAPGEDCPSDGFRGTIRPRVARRADLADRRSHAWTRLPSVRRRRLLHAILCRFSRPAVCPKARRAHAPLDARALNGPPTPLERERRRH